jgi:hypothetical protein
MLGEKMAKNTEYVYLSIVEDEEDPGDGYLQARDVRGNNLPPYWYKFTGGSSGSGDNGDVKVVGEFDDTDIEISLKGVSNGAYDLNDAYYKKNTINATVSSKGPNKFILHDPADVEGEAFYTVVAVPKNSCNPEIHCDPRIENDWPDSHNIKPGG